MEDKEYYEMSINDENGNWVFSYQAFFIPIIGDEIYYKDGNLEAKVICRQYGVPLKGVEEYAKIYIKASIRYY